MQVNVIPDWINFGLQLASSFILFMVIKHFAWAPMKEFLRQRQELVLQEMNHAEVLKADALALQQSAELQIEEARHQAREIVASSKKHAQSQSEEIISNANLEVQQNLKKAMDEIEQERKAVYAQIRTDIVELAIDSAEKMLQKEINSHDHEVLFSEFVAKVGGSNE